MSSFPGSQIRQIQNWERYNGEPGVPMQLSPRDAYRSMGYPGMGGMGGGGGAMPAAPSGVNNPLFMRSLALTRSRDAYGQSLTPGASPAFVQQHRLMADQEMEPYSGPNAIQNRQLQAGMGNAQIGLVGAQGRLAGAQANRINTLAPIEATAGNQANARYAQSTPYAVQQEQGKAQSAIAAGQAAPGMYKAQTDAAATAALAPHEQLKALQTENQQLRTMLQKYQGMEQRGSATTAKQPLNRGVSSKPPERWNVDKSSGLPKATDPGQVISEDEAQYFLHAAAGDPEKARMLAKQHGYTVQ